MAFFSRLLISDEISEVKVFQQISIHTYRILSLALILNIDSPFFFATDTLFTLHNLYFCLNNYKKGNEPLNRKMAFLILLRELDNEVISSDL